MPKPDTDIAKITPPAVAGALPRERLFGLLDEGREGSLIWVTAPGGAGKTTLVAQWLAARKLIHLWCRLDAGDDDPSSFFHYMGLAAARAFPRRKQPLPHLIPEYSLGMPIFARHFFEKLCTRLPRNGLVVALDNYQEVAEEAEAALLKTDDPATTLRMCNYLLAHYMFTGDFADMTRLMMVLQPLSRQIASDPSLRLLTLLLDGYYAFYVRGAPPAVNKLARKGLDLAAESGIRIYDFWLSFLLIISGLCINEQEMAEEKIQELLAWSPPLPTGRLGGVYSLAGSAAMLKQQWGEAISLLQRAVTLYAQDGNLHTSLHTRIYLSMALYNSGEREAAHQQLARVADQNWAGSAFVRYHALILSAWFDYCEA